jgi:hypothetical protein
MEHRTIDQIAKDARIARVDGGDYSAPWWIVRRQRLERLASLLDNYKEPIRLFSEMECFPKKERLALRQGGSPLAVAFDDPEFRKEGLGGDSIGDGLAFFHLSMTEAHQLLCYCGYPEGRYRGGGPTADMVARRTRSIASRRSLPELYEMAKAMVARWR